VNAGRRAGEAAAPIGEARALPAAKRIRVLIADDHAVVRRGLAAILNLEEDVRVVGEAGDGEQAVDCGASCGPT